MDEPIEIPEDAPDIVKKFVRLTELADMTILESDIKKQAEYGQEMAQLWHYVFTFIMQNIVGSGVETIQEVSNIVLDPNSTV